MRTFSTLERPLELIILCSCWRTFATPQLLVIDSKGRPEGSDRWDRARRAPRFALRRRRRPLSVVARKQRRTPANLVCWGASGSHVLVRYLICTPRHRDAFFSSVFWRRVGGGWAAQGCTHNRVGPYWGRYNLNPLLVPRSLAGHILSRTPVYLSRS